MQNLLSIILRAIIGKNSILNHEGEPVDITQAMCKLFSRVMVAKKSQTPVSHSQQKGRSHDIAIVNVVHTDYIHTTHIEHTF